MMMLDFAVKLLMLTMFFASLGMVWKVWPIQSMVIQKLNSNYDYVIVGGGTSGCVLANRLTENSKVSVVLLEAGDEETNYPLVDIPLAGYELQKTSADWNSMTVPQNNSCKSLKGQKSYWPRGKVLGGTSSINFLMYVRGSSHDYNEWAERGCKGWSYEDVLPYFVKAEKNKNKRYAKTEYHGTTGPLVVVDSYRSPTLTNSFLGAARELGFKVTDVNGAFQQGVMVNQQTTEWGRRMGTAKAYLRPVMGRPNLHVATNTMVTKILFRGKRAIGVEYIRNNTKKFVYAKNEVILAAGAIGSPHLLMVSGVGPKDHLEKLEIPVVADLPVGDNLQDHIWTDALTYTIKDKVSITAKKAKSLLSLLDFLVFGAGSLASSGAEVTGFFRSEFQPEEEKAPYLQFILFSMLFGNDKDRLSEVKDKTNMKTEAFEALHSKLENKEGVTLMPILLKPKSRGTIRLNSSNIMIPPDINPNYLEYPDDVKILVDGIRLGQTLMATKHMQSLGTRPVKRIHPQCQGFTYDSEAYWQCYIRHNTLSVYHPIGTCKMGADNDSTAVVNPELKVRGLRALRVVDGSIIPRITSGNPYAPIVMIAEKAADLIRGMDSIKLAVEFEEKQKKHIHTHHTEL